jgi:RNA polymerase sigma factor for flagellar operon FliA
VNAAAACAEGGDEAGLWTALREQDSAGAREQLFLLYAPLAAKIAKRCFFKAPNAGVELGDMRQWASTGLLEAIDGFDPSQNIPFAAYARQRIRGSILDGLAHATELHEQLASRARWRKQRTEALSTEIGARNHADSLSQLAELAIGLAIGFMLEDTSLYQHPDASARGPTAYESVAWKELVAVADRAVQELAGQERAVIKHHYGGEMAFTEIARLMNLSKGRVSQIHRAALTSLRRHMKRATKSLYDC